jgi:O-Antigen ligase
VVILHVVVWALAGLWVAYQVWKHLRANRPIPNFSLPQKLGLAMVLFLAIGAVAARAPALSAFKIYQMLVTLLFVHFFVRRFGRQSSLRKIFWSSALLCVAVALGAFLFPDLVWFSSDFNPDPSRLRGELIATTGVVSAFAIILLLTGVRKISRVVPALLLSLFLGLLALSLMRTAYVIVLVFLALALLKRPNVKPLRLFAYLACAFVFTLYAYNRLPRLSQYRDPESILSLDDRVGLWRYLVHVTFTQSPWLGLGYYSASRIYGPEYNPGLGTAHSMFVEVLLGGGVPSLVLLVTLCAVMSVSAARLLYTRRDGFSFAITSLFIACVLFGFMGEEIDSGPVAICFWYSAAVLPWLCEHTVKRAPRAIQIGGEFPAIPMVAKQPEGHAL